MELIFHLMNRLKFMRPTIAVEYTILMSTHKGVKSPQIRHRKLVTCYKLMFPKLHM